MALSSLIVTATVLLLFCKVSFFTFLGSPSNPKLSEDFQ